jgi:nucleosome assembly protein 1-like 1
VLTGHTDVTKEEDGSFTETNPDPATEAGVPEFWLRAMLNHEMLRDTIAEEDLPALELLTDVRCVDKEDYTVRGCVLCVCVCVCV